MKKFIAFMCLLMVFVGGYFLFLGNPTEIVAVQMAMADYNDIENTLELSGEIVAQKEITLTALTGGVVKELKVAAGQKVKKGDVVAILENPTASLPVMDTAAQSLAAANAQQITFSQFMLDSLLSQAKTGSMEFSAFNGFLAQQKMLDMQKAPTEIAVASNITESINDIRATMDGTVLNLSLKVGETAVPGLPVARIANLNKLSVECAVSERDLANLKKGMDVKVISRQDGKIYNGKISEISPYAVVKQDMTSYLSGGEPKLYATITPSDNFTGIVGLNVDVNIPYEKSSSALSIPIDCLSENNTVFVIQDDIAYERTVEVGIMDYYNAEILSGLSLGDKVAIYTNELYDGVKVFAQ